MCAAGCSIWSPLLFLTQLYCSSRVFYLEPSVVIYSGSNPAAGYVGCYGERFDVFCRPVHCFLSFSGDLLLAQFSGPEVVVSALYCSNMLFLVKLMFYRGV